MGSSARPAGAGNGGGCSAGAGIWENQGIFIPFFLVLECPAGAGNGAGQEARQGQAGLGARAAIWEN